MDLIEHIRKKIEKNNMPAKGATLLVAVSGGMDSISLLYSLLPLAGHYNWELVVAHLNHGLRKSADKDTQFVKDLASSLGLKFVSSKVNVRELAVSRKMTVEEAGRTARYSFFDKMAVKYAAEVVAVAHTADDQVETLVMNWLRGAFVRGLSGMRELDGNIWRPFLDVNKADIKDFIKKFKITYKEDESNKALNYTRNKIRHLILPMLLEYNLGLPDVLLRNANTFANLEDFLDGYIQQIYKQSIIKSKQGVVCFRRKAFMELHRFIQDELLLYAVGIIKGDRQDFKKVHLEQARLVLESSKKESSKQMPGKLFLIKTCDKITISRYRPKNL